MFSWYVHDDWRLTPKLTVNLGFRHELEFPTTERFTGQTVASTSLRRIQRRQPLKRTCAKSVLHRSRQISFESSVGSFL
jgi:hypothetical protein